MLCLAHSQVGLIFIEGVLSLQYLFIEVIFIAFILDFISCCHFCHQLARPNEDPMVALKRKQESQGGGGKRARDDQNNDEDLPIEER